MSENNIENDVEKNGFGEPEEPKMILGYYVNNRQLLEPSDIDPNLFTHIVFAYAKIENYLLAMSHGDDVKPYRQLAALKERNPNLKVLLSVQDGVFELLTGPKDTLSSFYKQAITFLRDYEFDGLELSCDNPKLLDQKWLSAFILGLHESLDAEIKFTRKKKLLLSIALPSTRTQLAAYDFDFIIKYIDFFSCMTYDLIMSSKKTGFHSPLHPAPGDNKFFSVSGLIDHFLELGIPSSKLLWGLPTYGRSFRLCSVNQHGFKAKSDEGEPGPILKRKGIFTYEEVGKALHSGAKAVYDEKCVATYLYEGKLWVAYEDSSSATKKALYFRDKTVGVAIWNLNLEDPRGKVEGETFPIVKAVHNVLHNGS